MHKKYKHYFSTRLFFFLLENDRRYSLILYCYYCETILSYNNNGQSTDDGNFFVIGSNCWQFPGDVQSTL